MKNREESVIPLSHLLHGQVPTWHGKPAEYELATVTDYHQCTTHTKFRAQRVSFATGLSTHIDAPAHCIPGGKTVDQLNPVHFVAPLVVIDVSGKAAAFYQVSATDILAFEHTHGRIEKHALICFHTGWSAFWTDHQKYQTFPALSAEAATLLVSRNPRGIGIDTHSVDILKGDRFPAHEIILGHGCYIIENMTNLDKVPSIGARAIVAPLMIKGPVEAPAHVIALCDKK